MNSLLKVLVILLYLSYSLADRVSWVSLQGGNWNDTQNWFPQTVPDEEDDVYIFSHDTNVLIQLPEKVIISSLHVSVASQQENTKVTLQGPGQIVTEIVEFSGIASEITFTTSTLSLGKDVDTWAVNNTVFQISKEALIYRLKADSSQVINSASSNLKITGNITNVSQDGFSSIINSGNMTFDDTAITMDVDLINTQTGLCQLGKQVTLNNFFNNGSLEIEETESLSLLTFQQMEGSSNISGILSAKESIVFVDGSAEISGILNAPDINTTRASLVIKENRNQWNGNFHFNSKSTTIINGTWSDHPSLQVKGNCTIAGILKFDIDFEEQVPQYDDLWSPLKCNKLVVTQQIAPTPLLEVGNVTANVTNGTTITLTPVYGLSLSVNLSGTLRERSNTIQQIQWKISYLHGDRDVRDAIVYFKMLVIHGTAPTYDKTARNPDKDGFIYQNMTYERLAKFDVELIGGILDCRYPELQYATPLIFCSPTSDCQATKRISTINHHEVHQLLFGMLGGLGLICVGVIVVVFYKKVLKDKQNNQMKWTAISPTTSLVF